MNTEELHTLTIQLLDKSWQMRCPEDKVKDLQKCIRLLDNKMREIGSTDGKPRISDRLIINSAIHVIYDLLIEHNRKELYIESLSSRIRELQNKMADTTA